MSKSLIIDHEEVKDVKQLAEDMFYPNEIDSINYEENYIDIWWQGGDDDMYSAEVQWKSLNELISEIEAEVFTCFVLDTWSIVEYFCMDFNFMKEEDGDREILFHKYNYTCIIDSHNEERHKAFYADTRIEACAMARKWVMEQKK